MAPSDLGSFVETLDAETPVKKPKTPTPPKPQT